MHNTANPESRSFATWFINWRDNGPGSSCRPGQVPFGHPMSAADSNSLQLCCAVKQLQPIHSSVWLHVWKQTLYSITARLLSCWRPFMLHAAFCSCFTRQTGQNNAVETESVCSLFTIVQLRVRTCRLRSGAGVCSGSTACSATPRFAKQCAFHCDLWLENRLNVHTAAERPTVFTFHAHTGSPVAVCKVTKAATVWCAVWPCELTHDLRAIHSYVCACEAST